MNVEQGAGYKSGCGPDDARDGLCSASVLDDLVTDRVFVIDGSFRILRVNKAFQAAFGALTQEAAYGRSLGALTDCRHVDGDGACGGTAACRECGWYQAVGACVREGAGGQECRILKRDGKALDFDVKVLPAGAAGSCICGLKDIYAAKRLRVMERSFFHDVTNLAAGIRGLCELIDDPDSGQGEELRPLIHDSANKLVDEIERLRTLRVAENGDLQPCVSEVVPEAMLQAVVERYQEDASARHLKVIVKAESAPPVFETDKELLALVLGELARNAIEASSRGETVTLTCAVANGWIAFSVHNMAVLDEVVRTHVFERSFTTRGAGRGVGAYRAHLIAERYMNGEMSFVSQQSAGTTFRVKFPLRATV